MKPIILVILAFTLACSTGCAANRDFDSVVSGVEQRSGVHAQRVPLMGFVSLCARMETHGGVKGMRIAEFDHLDGKLDSADLSSLVRSRLDDRWQPFVVERDRNGAEQTVIFVQPRGRAMRMLVADYDHGELDLVRMELNGSQLANWMHDPEGHAHHAGHHAEQGD